MFQKIFNLLKKQSFFKNIDYFKYNSENWQSGDNVIVISNSNKAYCATIIKAYRGQNEDWSNCFPIVKPFNSSEEFMVMGIIIKYDIKIWVEICNLDAITTWNKFCRPHARIE